MFSEPLESVPPPSPEAVESIGEIIELVKKGDRKEAGRLLGGYYRIVSPRMMAMHKLSFLNDVLSPEKKNATYRPSRMEFDWVHYADAALKLDLVKLVDNEEMLEAIEVVRSSNPPMEKSPELTVRYEQLGVMNAKPSGQNKNFFQKIFGGQKTPPKR